MAAQYPTINDNDIALLKKIANNTAIVAESFETGATTDVTTATLVGKTMTFFKGILQSFS